MEEVIDSDLAKELLTVFYYVEEDFTRSFPPTFFQHLVTLAADSEKEFYLSKGKNLKEQKLSEDCKNMLAYLYYQQRNKKEKEDLVNEWLNHESS